MGGLFAKTTADNQKKLNAEEYAFVKNSFKILSGNKGHLRSQDIIDAWSYLVDPEFVHHVKNACFGKSNHVAIRTKPFAKYFYVAVKGNVAEKANYIATYIFDNNPKHPRGVVTDKVLGFVTSTIRSYFLMLIRNKTPEYVSWLDQGVHIDKVDTKMYTQYVVNEIKNLARVSVSQLERWLCHQPLFMQIWKEVVLYLYGYMNSISLPKISETEVLPFCDIPSEDYNILPSVLSVGKLMFISDSLPMQYRQRWRPLFNLESHGRSFATMISKITNEGPTVLIVKDEGEYEFGGYASSSWIVGPKFRGDLTASLFTLKPKLDRFIASGQNNHYQYLNTNQQTIPNGLGMGGQYGYWGLWLNEHFASGKTSETCSTFTDYTQLSSQKEFQLQHLEIWAVGEQPQITEEHEEERALFITYKGTQKRIQQSTQRESDDVNMTDNIYK